jgi:tetratricopeptide (TPR) repeat protein/TolB-like protein
VRPTRMAAARVTEPSPSAGAGGTGNVPTTPAPMEDSPRRALASHEPIGTPDPVPTPSTRSPWRRPLIAAALVVLGVVGGRLLLPSLRASASPSGSVNRRIVVATFENLTGDKRLDPLGEQTADWLARTLNEANFEVFDSRTSSTISRMLASIGPKGTARDHAAALGKETNSAMVVTGRYYRERDSLQFEAAIMDPARGLILHAVGPIRGLADDAPALIGLLANRVTASLTASADTTAGGSTTSLTEPPSVRAFEHTSRAWEMFFTRPSDTSAVFAELARASAVDSGYATPRLMRAYVLDVKAQWPELAKSVAELEPRRDRMGRVEREALALFESDLRGDLLGRLRSSPDMALLLAVSASYLNRPQEAHDALVAGSPDRGISIVSPMYWAWRAHSEHMLGHYAEELEAAQQEARRFPTSETSAMGFARSYAAMGRSAALDSLLGRAGLGARSPSQGVRWLALLAARELRAHGHRAASQALFTRVAQLPRPAESNRDELLTHALALYEAGQLAAARSAYQALGASGADLEVVGRLGAIAARMSDTAAVLRTDDRLALWHAPFSYGAPTYWRAHIMALSGRRPEALAMLRSAIAAGYRPYDLGVITLHDEGDFAALWDDPGFRELVRPRTGPANLP